MSKERFKMELLETRDKMLKMSEKYNGYIDMPESEKDYWSLLSKKTYELHKLIEQELLFEMAENYIKL